ncbi:PUB1, partial [Acrasis kona]
MAKKLSDQYFYLDGLAQQQTRDGLPLYFTDGQYEAVLVERLSKGFGAELPIGYLLDAYKRASEELSKEENKTEPIESRVNKIKEIKRLIVSYAGILLTNPDMFPMPQTPADKSGPLQLTSYLIEDKVPDDFLSTFAERFKDEDTLEEVFAPIYTQLSHLVRNMTMLDKYMPVVNALLRITKPIPLATALVNHKDFFSRIPNGSSMEQTSILGPFFRLSCYYEQPRVGDHYFG